MFNYPCPCKISLNFLDRTSSTVQARFPTLSRLPEEEFENTASYLFTWQSNMRVYGINSRYFLFGLLLASGIYTTNRTWLSIAVEDLSTYLKIQWQYMWLQATERITMTKVIRCVCTYGIEFLEHTPWLVQSVVCSACSVVPKWK